MIESIEVTDEMTNPNELVKRGISLKEDIVKIMDGVKNKYLNKTAVNGRLEELVNIILNLQNQVVFHETREKQAHQIMRELLTNIGPLEVKNRERTEEKQDQPPPPKATEVRKTYAQAAADAERTILVEIKGDEEKAKEELCKKLEGSKNLRVQPERVIKTKKGYVIKCQNKEEAKELEKELIEKEGENIAVKEGRIEVMKVMIFNVPEDLEEDEMKEKLTKESGEIGTIQVLYKVNKEKVKHWAISLPKESAAVLLEKKEMCIGLKTCAIRRHTSIIRCFKCLGFDHTQAVCKSNLKYCTNCSKLHSFEEKCTAPPHCKNCVQYNDMHEIKKMDPRHRPNSGECGVYKEYRKILQVGEQMSWNGPRITGQKVMLGAIRLHFNRGQLSIALSSPHSQSGGSEAYGNRTSGLQGGKNLKNGRPDKNGWQVVQNRKNYARQDHQHQQQQQQHQQQDHYQQQYPPRQFRPRGRGRGRGPWRQGFRPWLQPAYRPYF